MSIGRINAPSPQPGAAARAHPAAPAYLAGRGGSPSAPSALAEHDLVVSRESTSQRATAAHRSAWSHRYRDGAACAAYQRLRRPAELALRRRRHRPGSQSDRGRRDAPARVRVFREFVRMELEKSGWEVQRTDNADTRCRYSATIALQPWF